MAADGSRVGCGIGSFSLMEASNVRAGGGFRIKVTYFTDEEMQAWRHEGISWRQ